MAGRREAEPSWSQPPGTANAAWVTPTHAPGAAGELSSAQYWLRTLEARNFRNLASVALALPPEGIVLVGDNGHGKTNLLEAIAYLHLLRSVRGAHDREVVRFGESGFSVRGSVALGHASESGAPHPADRSIVVGFERASRRKRVTVEDLEPERLGDALGTLPAVTFSVTDVELVRGGPIGRRRYLDVALATTSRRYLAALQNYRAALVRRNAALRSFAGRPRAAADAALGAWEPLLASSGATLWAERERWTARWTPEFARVSAAIGEIGMAAMRYVPRLPATLFTEGAERAPESTLAAALEGALAEERTADLRRGATGTGPHRDDFAMTIGGRDLRVYGSAGQQRTAAIALRILESYALRDHGGASPVLLFDDPFAELDERRARAILEVLGGEALGQVVLAVPRAADIPIGLTRLARFGITDGVLSEAA